LCLARIERFLEVLLSNVGSFARGSVGNRTLRSLMRREENMKSVGKGMGQSSLIGAVLAAVLLMLGAPSPALAVNDFCDNVTGAPVTGECEVTSTHIVNGAFTIDRTLHIFGTGKLDVTSPGITIDIAGDLLMDTGGQIEANDDPGQACNTGVDQDSGCPITLHVAAMGRCRLAAPFGREQLAPAAAHAGVAAAATSPSPWRRLHHARLRTRSIPAPYLQPQEHRDHRGGATSALPSAMSRST
jgi:hypothetical protein